MRPSLHAIKSKDRKGIVTHCGLKAKPYYSVFAEANGNCIVCVREGKSIKPTCPKCFEGIVK